MARGPRTPKVPKHLRRIAREIEPDAPQARHIADPGDGHGRLTHIPRGAVPPEPLPGPRRGLSRNQKIAIGVGAGAVTAGGVGLVAARRRQQVEKAAYSPDGTNVVRLTARTPSGKFVSHVNDLDVFHVTPKRNHTSRVLVARKGGDSASKPWVSKIDVGRARALQDSFAGKGQEGLSRRAFQVAQRASRGKAGQAEERRDQSYRALMDTRGGGATRAMRRHGKDYNDLYSTLMANNRRVRAEGGPKGKGPVVKADSAGLDRGRGVGRKLPA